MLLYRHFSWRMTVLGGKQFLKLNEAVLKLLSRLFSFVFLCWFVFSRFSSTLTGRKGGGRNLPRNCPETFGQDCTLGKMQVSTVFDARDGSYK